MTSERLNEILAIYDELKKRILAIDDKYSTDFHEPVLDLPETLGLEKLVFTPKSKQELTLLVRDKIRAKYQNKVIRIYTWRDTYRKDIASRRAKLTEKQRESEKQLKADRDEAYAAMYAKIARNGLLFSTVRETKLAQITSNYESKKAELQKETDAENAIIDKEEKAYDDMYSQKITNHDAQRQSEEDYYVAVYTENQRKEQERVDKYNQQLDEKETRYQFALEKFRETARKNEYDRVYKMTKLYAEIGETGINNRKLNEKFIVSKQYFTPLTREEAQTLLSADSFLRAHLDTYYSAFVTWVNNTLK